MYDDKNGLVAYINDLLYMQNETLNLVEGLQHRLQCTNDHLRVVEDEVQELLKMFLQILNSEKYLVNLRGLLVWLLG